MESVGGKIPGETDVSVETIRVLITGVVAPDTDGDVVVVLLVEGLLVVEVLEDVEVVDVVVMIGLQFVVMRSTAS